ncbi:MAG: RNA polymerase sigma factor [Pseudonocardiaceae bacterium]
MPDELRDSGDTAVTGRRIAGTVIEDLIAGASNGELASWQKIITHYGRLVIHAAMSTGLSRSDAADAAQLTWVRLWEHGHQIREPDHLAAWLVSTARREAIRLATAASRYVLCDPLTEYDRGCARTAGDVYPVEQEYDEIVEQALGRLPTRYQTLLRLLSSDFELSYSEVANLMGLPVGSIGPMRIRAIRMLEKTPEFTSGCFPRPALAEIAS